MDIERPDAGLLLVSEWTVGTAQRQRAVINATAERWAHLRWPEGKLSHTAYASADGTAVLHCSQWTGEDAARDFARTAKPEWVTTIDAAVPGIERQRVAGYRRYRGLVPAGNSGQPGCIVLVSIKPTAPSTRWPRWIR